MRIKTLGTLMAATAISFGSLSGAQAQTCTVYFSGSSLGSVAHGTTVVAHGPYTTSCTGSHSGSVNNLSSAALDGRIERFTGHRGQMWAVQG